MTAPCTIGLDLGGTNIKGGVCNADGRVLVKQSMDTQGNRGFEHVLERMARLAEELMARGGLPREAIAGVGIGAPGPMSHARGIVHAAPNLPGFVNVPLRDRLAARLGLPVVLENDANAAAYGEFVAGAGRGVRSLVMLTLGTGIGGGVVLDGRLWRGAFDNAGEVGHMIVVPDGRPCPCGQRGCLERYASANAVAQRLIDAVHDGAPSVLADRVGRGEALDARDVLAAMDAGDRTAGRIWDETCYFLAVCAVNLRHLLNPELIVLAGGLINAGPRLLQPTQAHFERLSWRLAPDAPRLALATLGPDAGLVGAALLARR